METAIPAEWTEANEASVRAWTASCFNVDSFCEMMDENKSYTARDIWDNENFSMTIPNEWCKRDPNNFTATWRMDVALDEWEKCCNRVGIVEDENRKVTIDPNGSLAKYIIYRQS